MGADGLDVLAPIFSRQEPKRIPKRHKKPMPILAKSLEMEDQKGMKARETDLQSEERSLKICTLFGQAIWTANDALSDRY